LPAQIVRGIGILDGPHPDLADHKDKFAIVFGSDEASFRDGTNVDINGGVVFIYTNGGRCILIGWIRGWRGRRYYDCNVFRRMQGGERE